ncbi:hypothetical protein EGR_08958 [Echinococcus granulosus]|uniref:Uncharacterized protein n=1 Tax=Echinococcus granulosus TaxID=6210 RepID=W6U512_ECHGR|nr:hypothetical protein EGR_08958 [Echinococcus granulosus]EUB56210.1 hypothetical protein EGR_08958 [Echinococcus granulosus]
MPNFVEGMRKLIAQITATFFLRPRDSDKLPVNDCCTNCHSIKFKATVVPSEMGGPQFGWVTNGIAQITATFFLRPRDSDKLPVNDCCTNCHSIKFKARQDALMKLCISTLVVSFHPGFYGNAVYSV